MKKFILSIIITFGAITAIVAILYAIKKRKEEINEYIDESNESWDVDDFEEYLNNCEKKDEVDISDDSQNIEEEK